MTGLHDLFLGVMTPPRSRPGPQEALERVSLETPALLTLRQHLSCPGRERGGPLFGVREDATLKVAFAATGGYPGWPGVAGDPLAMDDRYALGWADALSAADRRPLDWTGQWVMARHGQWPHPCQHLVWAERAQALGLMTDERPLLVVGWHEGRFTAAAYVQREEPTLLAVSWGAAEEDAGE
jgi:hypothetical protein